MYPYHMGGWGWVGMLIGSLLFLLLLAGLAVLIYFAVRSGSRNAGAGPTERREERRALEVLKERYARGEITREQYLAMREDLES